jgi:N-methylhydantoinase B
MPDRITVSVIQHRLEGIVHEMGEVMLRTAYSQVLNSNRDFSTSIFDGRGRLATQAEHIPIHVGALPASLEAVYSAFSGQIHPGDLFVLNDPYHGGSHLPDLTILRPIFLGESLVFWAVTRAHQADIGGATHGGYNSQATEIWQEGLRVTPLKLRERGKVREDLLNFLAANVRHGRDFLGDLDAMIGSTNVAERRLLQLVDEYGAQTIDQVVGMILDSAERQARACFKTWQDGTYYGESALDDDGHGTSDVCVRATVIKDGECIGVDLSQSDAQVRGFINSSYPNTISAVRMALAYLMDPDVPKNEGTFRPLTIRAKQGTVVWPNPPAAVTMCTAHCGQEIAEAVIQALSQSCPDRAVAGWSKRFRIAIRGVDPRTSKPFIWHLFHARGGGGASPAGDGWPLAGGLITAGGVKFGSIEVSEARTPVFFVTHEFRANSGGAGQFRGGAGGLLELRIETAEPAVANTAGDGIRHAPYGLFGGKPGSTHCYHLVSKGESRLLKTKEVGIVVHPGDRLIVEASGGGGYGDPANRDPQSLEADVRDGLVTREQWP